MLNLTRTTRFSPRVPEEHRAKKSQIVLTNEVTQEQIAIELRHILYKHSNDNAIAHSAIWRTYDGINEPFDTTVKKGEALDLWGEEEDMVTIIVLDIDSLERVEVGFHAPYWVAIERMDMEGK